MFKYIKSKIIIPIYLNLDNSLGLYFFDNLNLFSINIYNYLYKKIIFRKNYLKLTKNFINEGYQKIGKANIDYINEIKHECEKQNPKESDNSTFKFKNNEKIVHIIKKIILESCSDHIKEIESCYKSNIKLSWFGIARNYNHSPDIEMNSKFFHTDGYNLSLIKIFINLQNVNKAHGALQIIKKNYSKTFIKNSKIKNEKVNTNSLVSLYKYIFNRSSRTINPNQGHEIPEEMIFENLGEIGDILIANTTELIHRAGIPYENHHRDVVALEFIALPHDLNLEKDFFSLEKDYKDIYLDTDNWFSKKIAKPNGIRNLIKQFLLYKKN
jgi:hypothetical protein